ncbi:O-antigen ligase family protein [Agromyces sp. CFH 90414]|uniref:O-antigen ligase family protein n=1 Tax=Agromyces agglutinans TaxID=2662258 RepID=A0A6I2F9X4_9MICO|nr:O-antigen ligase family protein [Agromyces agglutinans]MRG60577.1 O-antigen ligase family protein [Agromyces agglutinans]
MTPDRRRALVGAFATFALFTLLAGQFWRNLLGWWGFGVVAVLVLVGAVWLVLETRPRWIWRRVPKSTIAFLGLATLSIAWSAYPAASVLGVATTLVTAFVGIALVLCLDWNRFVGALAAAIKWVLGLSIAFELWVALFVREPVLPNFPDFDPAAYADGERVPMAFYWSRALLFEGGPVEGIVASRNLLGMVALLGAVVFGALLASGGIRRGRGIAWLVVAGLMLVLTRSATVTLVGVLVLVALGFAIWARRRGPERRRLVYATAGFALVASVALLIAFWGTLLAAFGKSEDVTGRFDIWNAVIGLAGERPWFGWGWMSYWQPWAEPFGTLAERNGVFYLQAHNAWLDVWVQLGIVGVLAFASVVIGALWRSWFLAVDQPRDATGAPRPYTAAAFIPLLLLVALIGQSLAESRILVEGGFALLLAIAWATKRRQWEHEPLPAPHARPRLADERPGATRSPGSPRSTRSPFSPRSSRAR